MLCRGVEALIGTRSHLCVLKLVKICYLIIGSSIYFGKPNLSPLAKIFSVRKYSVVMVELVRIGK